MWNKLSVGKKFTCIQVVIALIILIPFIWFVQSAMSKTTQEQINLQITQFASIMNGNFEIISDQIIQESNNSLAFFESNFSAIYGEKGADSFQIGEPTLLESKNVPSLYYNGINLVGNTDLVDHFSALTGGVATIFVRDGNEFVRIGTSLKNEAGNRMVGTSPRLCRNDKSKSSNFLWQSPPSRKRLYVNL